ncbi:DUF6801 domain-containing protein [Streptomyces longispororuber]|uniref:DUF6801 domain-containing protein n=1 Tax=Streptomyces longispororuber TaxID=68230 RepID=UPI00210E45A1|nr:DUF6801 domain-containing protein [Streptomyces longispororuber]MCQ4211140.1 hypothetical protein [Streptomyces longispororuber]
MSADSKRTRGGTRHPVRIASVASAALIAGLLSGAGSRADEQPPAAAVLDYACRLPAPAAGTASPADTPAEPVHAVVKVATQLPETAVPGRPIQVGPVQLEAVLPRAALTDLLPAGTTGIDTGATLGVHVRQNEQTAEATWSQLAGRSDLPAEGADLSLRVTGEVPTVTVSSPGDLELFGGDLTLNIAPAAGGTPVTVTCAPAEGDEPLLARAHVPGGEPSDGPSAGDSPDAGAGQGERDGIDVAPNAADTPTGADTCPPDMPTGELDLSQMPPPLPGTVLRDPITLPGQPVCAYAVGFGTVRKLDGSMVINDPSKTPALMNVRANAQTITYKSGPYYAALNSLAEVTLPDAESTFLGFGFAPVTAKVTFETGKLTISTGSIGNPPNREPFAVATFFQSLRIHDVKVNGTPLDVGPDCRTSKPYRATLRADFSEGGGYKDVLHGGVLSGVVDIPAFTGCVGKSGENVDALFTASISGPGNLVTMNQAEVCSPKGKDSPGCPPVIPPLPPIGKPSAP